MEAHGSVLVGNGMGSRSVLQCSSVSAYSGLKQEKMKLKPPILIGTSAPKMGGSTHMLVKVRVTTHKRWKSSRVASWHVQNSAVLSKRTCYSKDFWQMLTNNHANTGRFTQSNTQPGIGTVLYAGLIADSPSTWTPNSAVKRDFFKSLLHNLPVVVPPRLHLNPPVILAFQRVPDLWTPRAGRVYLSTNESWKVLDVFVKCTRINPSLPRIAGDFTGDMLLWISHSLGSRMIQDLRGS